MIRRRNNRRTILGLLFLCASLSLLVHSAHALSHPDSEASTCLVCHLTDGAHADLNRIPGLVLTTHAHTRADHLIAYHASPTAQIRPWVRGPPALIL